MSDPTALFAYWTLLALASVTHASIPGKERRVGHWLFLAAGFLIGIGSFLSGCQLASPMLAALVAALSLCPLLFRSVPAVAGPGAGFLAAQSGAVLAGHGAPAIPAVLISAALLIVPVRLVRHSEAFAPRRLREEACLFLLAAGLALAAAPGIVAGWNSARALNAAATAEGASAIPAAVYGLVALAALAGVLSRWRRTV